MSLSPQITEPGRAQDRRDGDEAAGGARPDESRPVPITERGPAPVAVVVGFGFWLFLLSDIVMFAGFFAAYSVLSGETAGGPSGRELFDQRRVLIETACLLASSFTCGLVSLGLHARRPGQVYLWSAATFALGAVFLALEWAEFAEMVAKGAGPTRSAFLSAFFTAVGTHGIHVAVGLLWLVVMVAQVATLGFRDHVVRRFMCFNLFWHALDIVWIGLFTNVYLIGGR